MAQGVKFAIQEQEDRGHQEVIRKLHLSVLEEIDLESLNRLDEVTARERVRELVREILFREKTPLTLAEREQTVSELLNEIFGLGPLDPLLTDPTISDILINGAHTVYIERRGMLERTDVHFNDEQHLMRIIERIVSRVGRRVDESSPMVDARLVDGSRVNVIIRPLALDGPTMSIRRFGHIPLEGDDLVKNGTVTADMLEFLCNCVRGKLNILISGGTGAGKTTLLNVLSAAIPPHERVVTIEDAAELQLKQEHVVRLETRPPNLEGKGAVRQRQLLINSLRMRPDRIIIGEVRSDEALDMLQAMNTGHEGSMTTIHANSPRDALSRLETMVLMANVNLPDRAIRQQMASALSLVVQVNRLVDGSRKITSISEVVGMEGPTVLMQDLFVFEKQGYDSNKKVRGSFRTTGIRPTFTDRLLAAGIELPVDFFVREF